MRERPCECIGCEHTHQIEMAERNLTRAQARGDDFEADIMARHLRSLIEGAAA